ncbi:DNA polymerase Y family protein [Streptomyces sp. NPDC001070]
MVEAEPHQDPGPCVLYIRCGGTDPATLAALAGLVGQFTPVVRAEPPDAVVADVRSAVSFYGLLPEQLALMISTRASALYDVSLTIGVAGSRTVAAMASYDVLVGRIRAVDAHPRAVADFLRAKPVAALPGITPEAVRALVAAGLETAGKVAAAPLPDIQAILGAAPGRGVWERAHGLDPAPITPEHPPGSLAADRLFTADATDRGALSRAVLELGLGLGDRLRSTGRTASGLTLTIRLAGGSSVSRSRTLPEPTSDPGELAEAAYAMHEALGPHGAPVRAVALRAEGLSAADPHRARSVPVGAGRARAVFPSTFADPPAPAQEERRLSS